MMNDTFGAWVNYRAMQKKTKGDSKMETITVNGVEYVRKLVEGLQYVLVRTYSAGVFAGYLKERTGKEVTLTNARRIYYWAGAATLSQLAMEGTSKPDQCKFPQVVDEILLTEAIEIIPVTQKAKDSIQGVAIWKE